MCRPATISMIQICMFTEADSFLMVDKFEIVQTPIIASNNHDAFEASQDFILNEGLVIEITKTFRYKRSDSLRHTLANLRKSIQTK